MNIVPNVTNTRIKWTNFERKDYNSFSSRFAPCLIYDFVNLSCYFFPNLLNSFPILSSHLKVFQKVWNMPKHNVYFIPQSERFNSGWFYLDPFSFWLLQYFVEGKPCPTTDLPIKKCFWTGFNKLISINVQ